MSFVPRRPRPGPQKFHQGDRVGVSIRGQDGRIRRMEQKVIGCENRNGIWYYKLFGIEGQRGEDQLESVDEPRSSLRNKNAKNTSSKKTSPSPNRVTKNRKPKGSTEGSASARKPLPILEEIEDTIEETSPNDRNPFTGWVAFLTNPALQNEDRVRATADTGTEVNFVSMNALRRFGLDGGVRTMPRPSAFAGIDGVVTESKVIDVTVMASNESYSRRIECLVRDNPPFDLILGRKFIAENGFAFVNPVLPLEAVEFTDEEAQQIETEAAENEVKDEQLSRDRKFEDKQKHAKQRAQYSGGSDTQSSAQSSRAS